MRPTQIHSQAKMAAVQSPPIQAASRLERPMDHRSIIQIPQPTSITLPNVPSASRIRNSHLNLDTFSPVNQNGSFEFDRVLKCGVVEKRTRKTKARWRNISCNELQRKLTSKFRPGSPYISSFDQISYLYTETKRKTSFATRFTSPT